MFYHSASRAIWVTILLTATCVQAGTLTPGDNLILDGIPSFQDSVVHNTEAYSDFRVTSLSSWHPHKKEMLVLTRPSGGQTLQVHAVAGPLKGKTQLTSFVDRIGEAMFQPTHGSYFIFSKDNDGGEWYQNYRFDLDTQQITLLTDGKSKNSLGVWSHNGDRVAYTSNRRNTKDSDFYVMNPLDPSTNRRFAEFSQGDGWEIMDWSPDDTAVLALEYISVSQSYLWVVDVKTGQKQAITPRQAQEKIAHQHAKFSRDGKSVLVITDKDSEFLRLAQIDLVTHEYKFLTNDIHWDVESFALSPCSEKIAFTINEAGISKLHLLNLKTQEDQTGLDLPIGVISKLEWHPSDELLGFNLSSAKSPTDVYSWDIKTGQKTRWTETKAPGVKVDEFVEPRLVTWKSFDQRPISGFLYEPPTRFSGKRPIMIVIHGGPEAQARPRFLDRSNYYLNEMGIALLYPNIRGSTGYGKTFLQLPNGLHRVDAYEDINALLDWIKTQPNLDGDRILVTGGSYGGHMTLAVATRYNDKIAASIDIVGMSNLVTFLQNTEPYRQDLRREIYGDERDPVVRQFLESIAPLNHASKITKPLFVVQGFKDPRVPYTEAEQMVRTAKANKIPVWFLMAKDEGHGFSKKNNQDFQFYATLEFINQFILHKDSIEKEIKPPL